MILCCLLKHQHDIMLPSKTSTWYYAAFKNINMILCCLLKHQHDIMLLSKTSTWYAAFKNDIMLWCIQKHQHDVMLHYKTSKWYYATFKTSSTWYYAALKNINMISCCIQKQQHYIMFSLARVSANQNTVPLSIILLWRHQNVMLDWKGSKKVIYQMLCWIVDV